MSPITLNQVAAFAGGTLTGNGEVKITPGLHRLLRTLRNGDLFVALRGTNFDGYRFVESAAKRGAVAVLVERNWPGNVSASLAIIPRGRSVSLLRNERNSGGISTFTTASK